MGGFVGLRIAAQRSDLLKTLIVCGSSADAETDAARFAPLIAHLMEHGTYGVEDDLLKVMFGATSLADPALAEGLAWRARFTELPRDTIGLSAASVVKRGAIHRVCPFLAASYGLVVDRRRR